MLIAGWAQSLESLACHQGNAFTIVGLTKPRRVDGRLVCWTFFEVLRVQPQLGRSFRAEDDGAGAAPVAIVSDRLWKQELGADPHVLGRVLTMTERTFTIVGVMPPGFQFTRPEDVFVPIGLTVTADSGWLDRGNHPALAVSQLKPASTCSQPTRRQTASRGPVARLSRHEQRQRRRRGAATRSHR
jgi:putative ABC transport system permease protein